MNREDCDIDIRLTACNNGYQVHLKVANLKADPPFHCEKKHFYSQMPEDFESLILEALSENS